MIQACLCTLKYQNAPDPVEQCFARIEECSTLLNRYETSHDVRQSEISFPWKTNMPLLILREENLKWTVLPFSACCSITCFQIGKEVPEAHSQLSGIFYIELHASDWFCLALSCAGSWGGGPSAYPPMGFGANAGMVGLIASSPHAHKNLNMWIIWHHQH